MSRESDLYRNDLEQAKDAFGLRAMLGYVSGFEFLEEKKDEVRFLLDVFDGRALERGKPIPVPRDWEQRTRDVLTYIRDKMENDLTEGLGVKANTDYDWYVESRRAGYLPMSRDRFFTGMPYSRTESLRELLGRARTIDDLEVFCTQIEESPYYGFSRHGVEDQIDKVREILSEAKEKQSGQPFAHLLTEETRDRAMLELNKALWLMDKDSELPGYLTDPKKISEKHEAIERKMDFFDLNDDRLLAQTAPEAHAKIVKTRQDWSAARNEKLRVNAIKNHLPDIYNLCDKMEKEGSRRLGDSAEYKAMRDAAYHVRELTKDMSEADFNDRDKMIEVNRAIEELHAAAETYAKEKVYGKDKKSSTGISRKNTALALIDLTTVGASAGMRNEDVSDMRMSMFEGRKKAKAKRGLSDLIEEEKRKNEAEFGNRDKKEKKEAERVADAVRNRKGTRKSKQTAPAQKTS